MKLTKPTTEEVERGKNRLAYVQEILYVLQHAGEISVFYKCQCMNLILY